MTTTTGDRPVTTRAPRAARGRTPAALTARWLVRHQLPTLAWVAALLLLLVAGTVVVGLRLGGLDLAVTPLARQGLVWFPFAMAVVVVAAYVPVHLASGRTRRSLAQGSLVAAGVLGVAYAVMLTGAFLVERMAYGLLGWPHLLSDPGLAGTQGDVGLFLLDHLLAFVVAQVSGLLVGVVYYRVGGGWGTLALPLTVGPVVAVQGLLSWEVVDWPLAVEVLLAAAVVLAAAGVYAAILRGTPVRTTTAG